MPDPADVAAAVDAAIAEDLGDGDLTSESVIPADARLVLHMVARQDLVAAGLPVAREVFKRLAPEADVSDRVRDGDAVPAGAGMALIEGPARGLLSAERAALNIVQFLSGIATLTRAYADAIGGTGARLLDTRKTVPGMRALSKYATRMGGATNHRFGLYDGVLIKDNHIAVAGGVAKAVRAAKAAGLDGVQVECDTLAQVEEALAAGADSILLDNMDTGALREAVALAGGRVPLEASGGVRLETIRAIAETGVDFVSVGAITMAAPSVDIGLDLAPG
ncbi:MAG: carboxylating nicotinate-nucleotide diphosphorylase [Proteobacteria bacterium]|nr:carboxylating nicotinate-nucleotide diphosphorylase [Pseudomonadota bacterium]